MRYLRLCVYICLFSAHCSIYAKDIQSFVELKAPELTKIYQTLHKSPELSYQEKNTSEFIAKKLTKMGYKVTTHVGGYGVVALLKNGPGKTVMLRTDMDALPVHDETNKPYASKTPVTHACGHDMHMSVFLGTADYLMSKKDEWKGTLMFIAQPAEERGGGARAMLKDNLYKRFARPNYNLALHVSAELPAGKVGLHQGYAFANVDTVNITIRGIGGHGAYPHKGIDPVVLAAKFILSIQSIVSRNIDPMESAVVTVGSIHAGTKSNVIPDKADLKLSIRSHDKSVRQKILTALHQMGIGLAIAESLPQDRYPTVEIVEKDSVNAVYNSPDLIKKLKPTLVKTLGSKNVVRVPAVMASEDFGLFSDVKPTIPSLMIWLGSVDPQKYKIANEKKLSMPSLHSSTFDPSHPNTLKTGVKAMSQMTLHLLKGDESA